MIIFFKRFIFFLSLLLFVNGIHDNNTAVKLIGIVLLTISIHFVLPDKEN